MLPLCACWVLAIVAVHPVGNFPLMDDWMYGYGVRSLVVDGVYRVSPYMEATAVAHVLWGSLFAWVCGPTFDVLRISTLVLAPIGEFGTAAIADEFGASRATAIVMAAAFLFNPVVLTLSATFMTDVPFAAWSSLACLFLLRSLERPTWPLLGAGTAAACMAVLMRQQALAWPLAFVVAGFAAAPRSRRHFVVSLVPLAITATVCFGYLHWVNTTGRRSPEIDVHVQRLMEVVDRGWRQDWLNFAKTALNMSFHLGWYLLPAVLWTTAPPRSRRGLVWAGAIAAVVLATGKAAPWGSAVLYDLGIGPVTMAGGDRSGFVLTPTAPHWVWAIWTIAAWLTLTTLLARLVAWVRVRRRTAESVDHPERARLIFVVTALAAFLAPMLLVGFWDRYFVCLLPLLFGLILLVRPASCGWRPARWTAAGVLGLFALFGVLAAHDYLAWNRARWQVLNALMTAGYPPGALDGGFEFSGRYQPERLGQSRANPDASLVTSLERLPEMTPCGGVDFQRWLPPRRDRMWLLAVPGVACPADFGDTRPRTP
jgi:hypothetical protein